MRRTLVSSHGGRFVLGMLLAGLSALPAWSQAPANRAEIYHKLEVFGAALSKAQRIHVKPVDTDRAIDAAINAMLASLDPHSGYITPKAFAAMTARIDSPMAGAIGLELTTDGDQAPRIIAPIAGAPAALAGVLPGDAILSIDGESTSGLALDDLVGALEGPVGQRVTLKVKRGGGPDFDVTIVRSHVISPPATFGIESGYGLLRISAINSGTFETTRTLLSQAMVANPSLKGFVVDLRDCPGGLLNGAVAISGLFLNHGQVLSQRAPNLNEQEVYSAPGGDMLRGAPIVVLVNGGTASGCEIIAAALQDRGRAKVVGMPTFGEGSVQTVIPLNGGTDGAVKVTTSFIYRPSGRPIQKSGDVPDVVVANSRDAADRFARRDYGFREASLHNALDVEGETPPAMPTNAESPPASFLGDYQLQRAREVLRTTVEKAH